MMPCQGLAGPDGELAPALSTSVRFVLSLSCKSRMSSEPNVLCVHNRQSNVCVCAQPTCLRKGMVSKTLLYRAAGVSLIGILLVFCGSNLQLLSLSSMQALY
eukprot:5864502-Amphidinium_carterae.1